MDSGLNRRFYQRFSINETASLVTKDGKEKRILLKNFSSGGASIVMDSFPDASERVKLIIDAPAILDKPVTRDAEMVWCKRIHNNSWQLGLNFGVNRVSMPHALPKEEKKQAAPAKRFRVALRVSVFFIMTILLGIAFFLFKEKLWIYFLPQKSTASKTRAPLQIFSRSKTLQGITFDPRGVSFALINNKAVTVGERVDRDIEVKKINRNSVEIELSGKKQILELNKSIVVHRE